MSKNEDTPIEVTLTEITGVPTRDEQNRYHALELATRVNNFETSTPMILDRAEAFLGFLEGKKEEGENA